MKVLVTGASGFIGKHMCLWLKNNNYDVLPIDIDNVHKLQEYINECDFIIHLAGINRPLTKEEFYDGNTNLTKRLVDLVKESNKNIPILFSSSIQATLDNDYGISKRQAEDYLLESGLPVYVFRLANVFGKWCRPNYNSALATFCYNIANNLPIEIRDREYVVHYDYIDDICSTWIKCVNGDIKPSKNILSISPVHDCSLGHLADLIFSFKNNDFDPSILDNKFEKELYETYLSYESYRENK